MLFTEPIFLFTFLPLALAVLRISSWGNEGKVVPGHFRALLFLLTLIFYGWKEPWWIVPFAMSIAFDFLWASLLSRTTDERLRKFWCACSVVQNLSLLAFFKYSDFLLRRLGTVLPGLSEIWPRLFLGEDIVSLPAGISFYTFESLSFVIDVYRRDTRVPKSPLEFFAFIGMFPRFVAGPIVRYKDMVGQFSQYKGMQLEKGLTLFMIGLFLKCAFADSFAVLTPYAFRNGGPPLDFLSAWVGVLAYTLQIYFDFSGYSLMAIGLGAAMGFEFPKNFDRPYLASSLQDFWRRWHITLSTWLRDYLYIPLGGSRRGTWRTHLNLFLTMLLGGFWHGAQGTFLVWGAWHGTGLILDRTVFGRRPSLVRRGFAGIVVITGWVWFRAENLPQAARILTALFSAPTLSHFNAEALVTHKLSVTLCFLGVLFCFAGERHWDLNKMNEVLIPRLWERFTSVVFFVVALILTLSARTVPFLYFQF